MFIERSIADLWCLHCYIRLRVTSCLIREYLIIIIIIIFTSLMSYEIKQNTWFQTGKYLHLQLANGLHTKLMNVRIHSKEQRRSYYCFIIILPWN